ncbi:MAG: hypothetical protein ACPG9Q_04040 [Candidatus Thalassarchaeaceae archaeon]|jgi:hypothetical protein|tara:strand:- start:189 stop:428 length:240 start_codon:yes stop_codon:yes gene_type:complete
MKGQKRNNPVSLKLTLEHSDTRSLSSSLVTEALFSSKNGEISVTLQSDSFNDARARWNSIMRALIASDKSLEATRGEKN